MSTAKSFDIETARKSKKSFDIEKARYSAKSFDIEKARSGEINSSDKPKERGIMDRVFGTLYYNGIVEGLYNMVDDDETSTFLSGLKEGFKYMNPTTDDVSGRHTTSDILEAMGWEDKPDGKLNIGRGVVGFVGDVLLDPITYLNPFSAIGKVVKGTGVTADVAKHLKSIGYADDVAKEIDVVSGGVNAANVSRLKELDRATAENVIRKAHPKGVADDVFNKEVDNLIEQYNTKILKLRQGGEDFTIGWNNLPFSSKIKIGDKTLDTFKKSLVSSKTLRELGDKTIAPYYNSLAKKIRTSSLGQKFSKSNQIEAIDKVNRRYAVSKFHTEKLLSAKPRLATDVKDIGNAGRIQEYWEGLTKEQQHEWLNAYETGAFKDALEFKTLRSELIKKAGGDAEILDEDLIKNLDIFLAGKSVEFKDSFRNIYRMFGEELENASPSEVSKYMNLAEKLKGVSYKDLMTYNYRVFKGGEQAKFADFLDDQSAYEKFLSLSNQEKELLIKGYGNVVGSSDLAAKNEANFDAAFNKILQSTNPALANEIHKTQFLLSRFDALKSRFGDEGFDIAELISKRMDEIAEEEVKRGLLEKGQWEKLSGKYLLHLPKKSQEALKDLTDGEVSSGAWNPDVMGIKKDFKRSRTGKTIVGTNEALKKKAEEEGIDVAEEILETALHEIYLTRALGGNKLVFGYDTQKYIVSNFAKPLKENEAPKAGHSVVASFKDIDDALNRLAYKTALNEANKAGRERPDSQRVEQLYEEIKRMFAGDEKRLITYTPNVPMQVLDERQRKVLMKLKVMPVQMADDILETTNVLSRTQQIQLGNDMLNLYDRFQNIWKLQNTIVHPGFHIQNAVSNAFQSFLAIGEDALNPKQLKKAYEIFRNPDPKQTMKIGDKVWTHKELNYLMTKLGVIDEMFHTYELKRPGEKGILKGIPSGLDPTNVDDFFLYKLGTKAGTAIEGTQRANIFLSAMKQGQTPEQAAETVDKFLFDYSELTEFEQNVMKRVLPFYTYMRKNIPMELEQMLAQPTTYTTIQKVYNNVEKSGDNEYIGENDRSEWRQEHVQFPFDIDGQTYGISDQLPYNQLERVFDLNKLLGQTTPLVKTPIEAMTGKYVYTGMDIESPKDYLLNQTFWTKWPNIAANYEDPTTRKLYILGQLLGMPIGEINKQW